MDDALNETWSFIESAGAIADDGKKLTAGQVYGLPRLTPEITGIYFLFKDGDCVYVGKSRQVHLRVREHMRRDFRFKDFESYSWVTCSEGDLTSLEIYYIALLRPILNIQWTDIGFTERKKRPRAATIKAAEVQAAIDKARESGECSKNIKRLIKSHINKNKELRSKNA